MLFSTRKHLYTNTHTNTNTHTLGPNTFIHKYSKTLREQLRVYEANNHFLLYFWIVRLPISKEKRFLWRFLLGVCKSSKSVLFAFNLLRHVNRVKWSIPREKLVGEWLKGLFPSTNGFHTEVKMIRIPGISCVKKNA